MQYSLGALGVFSWPSFVDPATGATGGMIVAIVVSLLCMVASFIGVFLTYNEDK